VSRWDHYGSLRDERRETVDESVESDAGLTKTTRDGSKRTATGSSSEEAKLRAYDTLRDEILKAVDRQITLNTRGVGAIVLIIGYSINFDQLAVLAVVPAILSYLLVRTAESRAWMTNASGQIAKIEREISTEPTQDSFGFEHQLGGFGSEDITGARRLRDVPAAIRIVFVGGVYAITVVGVLYQVWPLNNPVRLLNVTVTRSVLMAVYGVFTVFILTSAVSLGLFMLSLRSYVLTEHEG
jgi:hypothetical protein